MEIQTGKKAKTAEQLLKELDIAKIQMNAWLKQAVSERHLRKLSKPVQFAFAGPKTSF
jgi:hypothetical protein